MKEENKSRKKPIEKRNNIKKTIEKEIVKTNKNEKTDTINKTVEFNLLEVIIIVLITGIVVSIASGLIVYNNYDKLNIEPTINKTEELNEFVESYNHIVNSYVEEVNKKELIDAAIEGMYNYLNDGYSMYLNKEDTSTLEEQLTGEYTGIGIEIRTDIKQDGTLQTVINRVFSNTPAQKAGLKEGDILIKVDDIQVIDASTVADTIKKGNKESYDITFIRDGKEQKLTIKREKVYIDSVSSKTYDNVGYIKIDTFSATTSSQVTKAINSFDKNVTSIVIDVRDNTGGYLNSAYETADLFIEKDKVVYQLKDRNEKITKYKAKNGVLRQFKNIAVITNSNSASASEILALALKESANAKIVGTKSYGKGTVQDTEFLSSGAMVKYTTSYWLSPNGNSINKIGIQPDIEISDKEKQLDEAIKVVK